MINKNKKEPDRYEMKTLEDILKVIDIDNVENFSKDFSQFLGVIASMKGVAEAAGERFETKDVRFTWIDDGKHDANITINVIDKK